MLTPSSPLYVSQTTKNFLPKWHPDRQGKIQMMIDVEKVSPLIKTSPVQICLAYHGHFGISTLILGSVSHEKLLSIVASTSVTSINCNVRFSPKTSVH